MKKKQKAQLLCALLLGSNLLGGNIAEAVTWDSSHDYNEDLVLTEVLEVDKNGHDSYELLEVKVKGNLEVTTPGNIALSTYGSQGVRSFLYVNSDKNKTVKIEGKIRQSVDSEIYVNFSNSASYLAGDIDVEVGSIEPDCW